MRHCVFHHDLSRKDGKCGAVKRLMGRAWENLWTSSGARWNKSCFCGPVCSVVDWNLCAFLAFVQVPERDVRRRERLPLVENQLKAHLSLPTTAASPTSPPSFSSQLRMVAGCGNKCVKYIHFVFNFLFFVSLCVILFQLFNPTRVLVSRPRKTSYTCRYITLASFICAITASRARFVYFCMIQGLEQYVQLYLFIGTFWSPCVCHICTCGHTYAKGV